MKEGEKMATNEVATTNNNELSFSDKLSTELVKSGAVFADESAKKRFVTNALALLNGNETLSSFARTNGTSQIMGGLIQGAQLNLDFMNREAYLVPYGKKLDFMISPKGAVKLAKSKSVRPIREIYSKIVREGDFFELTDEGGVQSYTFKPKPFNNAEVIGVFAVAIFEDGGLLLEMMNKDDLDACRNASKASNSPAWKNFTTEMYRKCAIHRLCKNISLDLSESEYNAMMSGIEIATEPSEIRDNEIEGEANTVDFVEDEE